MEAVALVAEWYIGLAHGARQVERDQNGLARGAREAGHGLDPEDEVAMESAEVFGPYG